MSEDDPSSPVNPSENFEVSMFHSGISQPQRISFIKYQLISARINEEYHNWLGLLSSYLSEIYERLTPDEIADCDKMEQNLQVNAENDLFSVRELTRFERRLNVLAKKYNLSSPDKIDKRRLYDRRLD
jgi:hypothetical protein